MLRVGDIFEAEGSRWVVVDSDSYEVRYNMFDVFGETEHSYLARKLSKNNKPLKSTKRFSTMSGAPSWVSRGIKPIGKAKVEYVVSDVRMDVDG